MTIDYIPRAAQVKMRTFMIHKNRCNIWADPGVGKSAATYECIEILRLLGSQFFPWLILAPKRVAVDVWPREHKKWAQFADLRVVNLAGCEDAHHRIEQLRRPADVYVINYDLVQWLVERCKNDWPFKGVVADECFPAGTPISTIDGEQPIEAIRAGDTVLTHLGPRKVIRTFTKLEKPFNLVTLTSSSFGKSYETRVTRNHPVCTDAGWVRAENCKGRRVYRICDMSDLPEFVSKASRPSSMETSQRHHSVLLWVMSHKRTFQIPARAKNPSSVSNEENATGSHPVESWKNVFKRAVCSNVRAGQSAKTKAKNTGRQRARNVAYRGINCAADVKRLCMELLGFYERGGTRISESLQIGFCSPAKESLLRSRWKFTPNAYRQDSRREKNSQARIIRVESDTNHEQGCLVPVYNLEVEDAHTYFANGLLVHNCTRLKSFRLRRGGKRATALAKMQKHVGRWINLTGTPSPNGLIDLWGQCWFLDRGERLGRTFGEFKQRYFIENQYTGLITPRRGAEQEIGTQLSDITLSLRAKDYFDLPPLTSNCINVQLTPKARGLYNQMERAMFAEIEGKSAHALNAATVTIKCLQMASGAVYTEGHDYSEFDSAKLDALGELLEGMNGKPLLVAYHWKFDKTRIMERFPQAVEIKSSESIDEWNAGKISLGLIFPGSAGHGIDLAHGGHHLCFYSLWWDLEAHLQVIERLGPTRQAQHGLNCPVFLHYLIAENTLDETVMERISGKRAVQDLLLERMKKS